MKQRGVLAAGLIVLTSLCSGCGYLFGDKGFFRDSSGDYRDAPYDEQLAVPQGMSDSALGDAYVVPDIVETVVPDEDYEVPRPAPLTGEQAQQTVRIQRLGDENWALFRLAPGQLWPQVRGFLSESGLNMAYQDAKAGIMDSDWVRLESASVDSRFRFRIDQGVQRGSSELHILQMNKSGNDWPAKSDDGEQEQSMLKAVAQYVANRSDAGAVSMLAERGISAQGRVVLREAKNGDNYLELNLPFYRAWPALAPALEKSAFEITDRNRSDGHYYVSYLGVQEEEEEGWFSRIWGSSDEDPLLNQAFVVTLTEQQTELMRIDIAPAEGVTAKRRDLQRLLLLIKGNIN